MSEAAVFTNWWAIVDSFAESEASSIESGRRISHRLARPEVQDESTADYAEAATKLHDLEYIRRKGALTRLVKQFETVGLSHDDSDSDFADPASVEAAITFLQTLLFDCQLPKATPDSDGDIMMVWETPDYTILLTVAKWRLHAAIDPGTARSEHIDNVPFDGDFIPARILNRLPV